MVLSLLPPQTFTRTDSPVQLFFGGFSSFPENYGWCSKTEGKAGAAILPTDLQHLPRHVTSILISQDLSVYDYSLNVQDATQRECQRL